MIINNKDDKRRHEILGLDFNSEYKGGIKDFENASYEMLDTLLKEHFASENDSQNYSPTYGEIMEFMYEHPGKFCVDGYIVSPERFDYRVSIDSIHSISEVTREDEIDFIYKFREADDFSIEDRLYAWFD